MFSLKLSRTAWAALLLALAIFGVGVRFHPVMTIDGAIRANEARTMVRTGQVFPVVDRGEPVSDHPPLFVWATAASMKVFGVNDVAVQWPSRFFAILTVLATYALGLAAGLSPGRSLFAVILLCLTRDFVLNGVRGYIEPLISAFSYGAFALILFREKATSRRIEWLASALAGILIFLALFSKGPPAAWPLIFLLGVLVLRKRSNSAILGYFLGLFVATAVFVAWTLKGGYGVFWKDYWFGQVLESAMGGRHGLQPLDPGFFFGILLKRYWPGLVLIGVALVTSLRDPLAKKLSDPRWLFLLFGAGFIGGFSLVRWKFWYYIVPAYPAFSLFIAAALPSSGTRFARLKHFVESVAFPHAVTTIAIAWAFIAHLFPIPMALIRVPEALAFETTIRSVQSLRPVWQVRSQADPNLTGVVEEWYFDRVVLAVTPEDESRWAETRLRNDDFVISDVGAIEACQATWCRGLKPVLRSNDRVLYRYQP